MRRLAIVLAILAAPVAARSAAPPPASAAEIASARDEADAIMNDAAVADLFENVTNSATPQLRHRRSGMACLFEPGAPHDRVIVYPGPRRGENVSCGINQDGAAVTQYVTRLPSPAPLQAVFQVSAEELRRFYPDMAPALQPFADGSAPGAPQLMRLRFVHERNGQKVYSRLVVAVVGNWVVKQRETAPLEKALSADLFGEVMMMRTALDVAAAKPD